MIAPGFCWFLCLCRGCLCLRGCLRFCGCLCLRNRSRRHLILIFAASRSKKNSCHHCHSCHIYLFSHIFTSDLPSKNRISILLPRCYHPCLKNTRSFPLQFLNIMHGTRLFLNKNRQRRRMLFSSGTACHLFSLSNRSISPQKALRPLII